MTESITQFYNEAYEAEMTEFITIKREIVQQVLDTLEDVFGKGKGETK